jgi:hypothetical protein
MTLVPFPASSSASANASPLAGTLPVRPFHPQGFFGTVEADGQMARVAALACADGKVLLASLVGYDTTVSATLAQLWQSKSVTFTPKPGVEWGGPQSLQRRPETYKQLSSPLPGTKEVHVIALSVLTHIGAGLRNPPPMLRPEPDDAWPERGNPVEGTPVALVPQPEPRYLLGNWDEAEPNQRAFLANLYAMRVIFLHQERSHPEWITTWARALWTRGLDSGLVVPVETLGIRAWSLVGTTAAWNRLIGQGVSSGWLPWREDEPALADAA